MSRWSAHMGLRCLLLAALAAPLAAGALDPNLPEAAVAASVVSDQGPSNSGYREAVASAHPLASEAGLHVLRAGGSAVDAAVAVQAVLGLVEPQSSGLGGGGFMLVADRGQLSAWDGRETAPAGAREDRFLQADGQPLPFEQAVPGGRSVGVPGVLRMLAAVHRQHGRLPWQQLFQPAITLARAGFPISPRLAGQIAQDAHLARDPVARAYFFDAAGQPWPAGHRLRNLEYAAILSDIARHGAAAFYRGTIAAAIVDTVHQAATPGDMQLSDLSRYRALRRAPLCTTWQQLRLCGMPPPSAGMLVMGQVLGMLEARGAFDAPSDGFTPTWSAAFTHLYIEAARLAQADRDHYVADPAYVPAPGGRWSRLLDHGYLARRAAGIGPQAAEQVQPGIIGRPMGWARDQSGEVPATTHLSIADARGQVIAMTSSIESQFGARLMVNRRLGLTGGFLLNNELTDFSFIPRQSGHPVANRVEPGKRPRSSMSPTLVLDQAGSRVLASLGSPGGPPIPHYVMKALIGHRMAGLPLQAAFDLPNIAPLGPTLALTLIEADRWPPATLQSLRERGHPLKAVALPSGLQGLVRSSDGRWQGAADTRREGTVAGR